MIDNIADESARYTLKIIKERRSVRAYAPDAVAKEDLAKLLEAACWAPSGSNQQNWHFIVVQTKELIDKMDKTVREKIAAVVAKIESPTAKKEYSAYSNYYTFFSQAPVVIAVVKRPYNSLARRIMERYHIEYESSADVQGPSAAIQNLLLMAHALGYGSCWMTGPLIAKKELEAVLDINAPDSLMALLPIGRPADNPKTKQRKPLEEVVSYK